MPFKLTDKIFVYLGYFANFMIVNILCLFCSIPIITAGPAICAMYHCMLRFSRKEVIHPIQDFFRSFRENFKQGCLLQLIVTVISLLLLFNLRLAASLVSYGIVYKIFSCILLVIAFVIMLTFTMLYPVQAQFSNPLIGTLKNSALLAFAHFPRVFLMMCLNAMPFFLFFLWMKGFLFMIPIYVFFGFSMVCFFNCLLLKRIFRPYIPVDTDSFEE